jgi:hypothetical protein
MRCKRYDGIRHQTTGERGILHELNESLDSELANCCSKKEDAMCLLVAEILMLIGGLYALIVGRIKLTNSLNLTGWRARVAGLFLVAPFPIALLIGFLMGVLIGLGALPASALNSSGILELLLVVGCLIGVVIFAWAVEPKQPAPEE